MELDRRRVNPITSNGSEWITEVFHTIGEVERRKRLLERVSALEDGYDEHGMHFSRVILFGFYDEACIDSFIDGEALAEAELPEPAFERRPSKIDAVDTIDIAEYVHD